MMNIALIPHLYYPNIGGVEIAVENLAAILRKNNYNVFIVTARWPRTLKRNELYGNIKITRLPFKLPNKNPINFLLFCIRFIQCIHGLSQFIIKNNIELINLHYISENALYILLIKHFFKIPLVVNIHGSDIELFSKQGFLNRFLVNVSLRQSDVIISNSQALLNATVEMFGAFISKKAFVIGNGVDITVNRQSFLDPGISPFILSVGRLEYFKGFDVLIDAFSIVAETQKLIKLVIIGGGTENNKLTDKISSCKSGNRILLLGHLDHNKVEGYFNYCDFFVLPSRREAFGIVCLEAMGASKAVIATKTGGVPEIVENDRNGLLVDAENISELAQAIIRLIKNPGLAQKFGANGRKLVEEKYGWENITQKYIEIYQQLNKISN
jgi:L-malate glycosyltransferase